MYSNETRLSISELSSLSGLPISTIKYYIRKQLLPGPTKINNTRGYYTYKHLHRLKLIRKIQKDGNMPLRKIKEITRILDDWEENERHKGVKERHDHKEIIIQAATPLFREKGYEAVTISDIVSAANIGRSTFYRNFKNKKDLFIECIRKIVFSEGIPEGIHDIESTDAATVFDKSAESYFREGPLWRDMIKRLHAAAINNPSEFESIHEEIILLKVNLFKKRIQASIKKGFMRKVNPMLLAVMILGIQDSCSEFISKGRFNEPPELIFEQVKDILLHGVMRRK